MKSTHFLYDSPYKRKVIRNILLLIPGIAADFVIHSSLIKEEKIEHLLVKLDTVYLIIIGIMICNSLLLTFLDIYSKSDRSRHHPLKGVVQALQIALAFVGIIIITATLIGKSPAALLTGLGASAAVLMLIFKDSILGFVSGAQLVQNNMIRMAISAGVTAPIAKPIGAKIVEICSFEKFSFRKFSNVDCTFFLLPIIPK